MTVRARLALTYSALLTGAGVVMLSLVYVFMRFVPTYELVARGIRVRRDARCPAAPGVGARARCRVSARPDSGRRHRSGERFHHHLDRSDAQSPAGRLGDRADRSGVGRHRRRLGCCRADAAPAAVHQRRRAQGRTRRPATADRADRAARRDLGAGDELRRHARPAGALVRGLPTVRAECVTRVAHPARDEPGDARRRARPEPRRGGPRRLRPAAHHERTEHRDGRGAARSGQGAVIHRPAGTDRSGDGGIRGRRCLPRRGRGAWRAGRRAARCRRPSTSNPCCCASS